MGRCGRVRAGKPDAAAASGTRLRIAPSTDLADLADRQLEIEAVFEQSKYTNFWHILPPDDSNGAAMDLPFRTSG